MCVKGYEGPALEIHPLYGLAQCQVDRHMLLVCGSLVAITVEALWCAGV